MKIFYYLLIITLLQITLSSHMLEHQFQNLKKNKIFLYGKQYPNGVKCMDYIYTNEGTWKEMNPLEYIWNYYDFKGLPPNHPYDKDKLIQYANGEKFTTCYDPNQHLLCDFDHTGSVEVKNQGFAFHEHNGYGRNNTKLGTPFTQFWYDDNWLARYVFRIYQQYKIYDQQQVLINLQNTYATEAYGKQPPNGLTQYDNFTRWQIMGGDTSHWTPYGGSETYVDLAVLNGLYYLAKNLKNKAVIEFNNILRISRYQKVGDYYVYPGIGENYKIGLSLVFVTFLMDQEIYVDKQIVLNEVLQQQNQNNTNSTLYDFISQNFDDDYQGHFMSLRKMSMDQQYRDKNTQELTGWGVWNNHPSSEGDSLMNTETMVANALGLGAGSDIQFDDVKGDQILKFHLKQNKGLKQIYIEVYTKEMVDHYQLICGENSITIPIQSLQRSSKINFQKHTHVCQVNNSEIHEIYIRSNINRPILLNNIRLFISQ